jgi:hypothetical protein
MTSGWCDASRVVRYFFVLGCFENADAKSVIERRLRRGTYKFEVW